jgi:methylphosphotriester-DNA--protein-cysteine methyltransferase
MEAECACVDDDLHRRLCAARRKLAEDDGTKVAIVARACGLSPRHFIRSFKALFGLTPHAYRIRTRLERARVALAAGPASVTVVAFDAGHSSSAHFSDTFRRVMGETPTAFRRRATASNDGSKPDAPSAFPGCLCLMSHLPP